MPFYRLPFCFQCMFVFTAIIFFTYGTVNALALITFKNIIKNIRYGKTLYAYTKNQMEAIKIKIPHRFLTNICLRNIKIRKPATSVNIMASSVFFNR